MGHKKKVESNALKKFLSDVYKVGKSDSLVNRFFSDWLNNNHIESLQAF